MGSLRPGFLVAPVMQDWPTISVCLRIARGLPEYFNEGGLVQMGEDLRDGRLYVAGKAEAVVGFAVVWPVPEDRPEILWMAVRREWRRRGIGAALVGCIAEDLRPRGARFLIVRTLAEEADYPPYECTRMFYKRMGFAQLGMSVYPGSGWAQGDPCAVYMREV